ncbi:MAG: thiamine-phosphate kinase [Rikenellaceae bacterium]
MSTKKLDELRIINNIQTLFSDISLQDMEGISDDCAVVPINDVESLVITTDTLTESTHFLKDKISAYDLGYKSLASNFSDVFSMGAAPMCTFLSIALKKDLSQEWVDDFLKGYHSLSLKEGVPLLGGDTTMSKHATTITVTAIGKMKTSDIKRRRGAKVGDIIVVCAPLAASGVGLNLLLDNQSILYSEDELKAIKYHTHPPLYGLEARFLAEQEGVTAMMDISDGIAKDLKHILKLSNCGAKVFCDKLPVLPFIQEICKEKKWDITELALCGGEEYSPLFTISADDYKTVKKAYNKRFKKHFYPIGVITDDSIGGIKWMMKGQVSNKKYKGYVHNK